MGLSFVLRGRLVPRGAMHRPAQVDHITALPSRQTSQMAPEVYSIILGNFCTSKQGLSSFSLVCKSWLSLCRDYLFAEVNYHADFARLLASSTHAALTIGPHIRKVTLKGPVLDHEMKHRILDSILCLPGLTALHVERFGWDSTISLPSESPSFQRLFILNLRSTNFPSFAALAEFLDLFSALQELSLDDVSWEALGCLSAEKEFTEGTTLKPSSLKKLRSMFCHNRILLNWLSYGVVSDGAVMEGDAKNRRSFPHLVSLSLPDILPGEADILGVFLAILGESLETVEVGILVHNFDTRNHDPFMKCLHLTHNINLKAITINQITLFQFPSLITQNGATFSPHELLVTTSPYAWIQSFISTSHRESLQTIAFHIWLSAEEQLDGIPWPILSNALANIGMREIHFHISGVGRDMDLVKAWFTKRLTAIDPTKTTIEFQFSG
ncbi:hypothetical protein BDZ97DRAFT_1725414 [Flammula alnicola]|nr:hypothetical protein BDZ97DRAFT_1725414 [Flammula alnicola]